MSSRHLPGAQVWKSTRKQDGRTAAPDAERPYQTDQVEPIPVRAVRDLQRLLRESPHEQDYLLGCEVPVRGGSMYILMSERLVDVVAVIWDRDGWRRPPGAVAQAAPRGRRLLRPRALTSAEWDAMSRQRAYNRTFDVPPDERGRELAGSLCGAAFDLPGATKTAFISTTRDAICADIFEGDGNGRIRRVVNLALWG